MSIKNKTHERQLLIQTCPFTYKIRILGENIDRGVIMKKKKLYKSNGIKTASPADTLELEDVKKLEDYFKQHNLRDWCMWTLNNNIGLRAKDLLSIPIDLLIQNDKVVDRFVIYEQKTNKRRYIELNNKAKDVVQMYYDTYREELLKKGKYLFPSRKSTVKDGRKIYLPLSVSSYDKVLRKAKHAVGIDDYVVVSSHCSRKILGCTLLENGVPIEQVQAMFQHSTPETTLIYTQIRKKYVKELYHKVEI